MAVDEDKPVVDYATPAPAPASRPRHAVVAVVQATAIVVAMFGVAAVPAVAVGVVARRCLPEAYAGLLTLGAFLSALALLYVWVGRRLE